MSDPFVDKIGDDSRSASSGSWPAFPDGVRAHDSVDLTLADPAAIEGGPRRCVASKQAGERCRGQALNEHLLCPLHDGRLDAAEGGRAKHRLARERRERAENRAAIAALGTRAVVAAALAEKHEEIRKALHVLATAAAGGDVKSAQALIPWLNQGLGMPTERIDARTSVDASELAGLSTGELQEYVALKRRERLRSVADTDNAQDAQSGP